MHHIIVINNNCEYDHLINIIYFVQFRADGEPLHDVAGHAGVDAGLQQDVRHVAAVHRLHM